MILLESAESTAASLDRRLILAAQLEARGHAVVIAEAGLDMAEVTPHRRYQLARFLADMADAAPHISQVIVLVDGTLSSGALAHLRSLALPDETRVTALGRFDGPQARIDAQARLAYALGREPSVVDLAEEQPQRFLPGATLPVAGTPLPPRTDGGPPRLLIALGPEALDQPETVPALTALAHLRSLAVSVLGTQAQKAQLVDLLPPAILVLGEDELAPVTLAAQSDIAVLFGPALTQERLAALALDMIASARVVVDGTAQASLSGLGAPVLRGPEGLGALLTYLSSAVLPHLPEITQQVARHPWRASHGIGALERALGLDRPPEDAPQPGRTVYLPTNGVGLGHARRCLMLAQAANSTTPPLFAAFPSCIPMIEDQGHACLPWSRAARRMRAGTPMTS